MNDIKKQIIYSSLAVASAVPITLLIVASVILTWFDNEVTMSLIGRILTIVACLALIFLSFIAINSLIDGIKRRKRNEPNNR